MIIDCHTHIASPRHLPQDFFDGWASTIKAGLPRSLSPAQEHRVHELLANLNYDPRCEQLVREMDAAAIDIGVLLVVDFAFAFPSSEITIESLHAEVAEIAARTQRFVAFAGVDPRRGQAGVDLLERAVTEGGFTGLKLYPPCGYSPSDRRLFPFYEVCAAHGIPVLTHVGPTTSTLPFAHTHPQDVDAAAHAFPGVNFILAHAGVVWHREASMLAEFRPNVFLDISGFQAELRDGGFADIMKTHMRRRLSRKLLFGTDWPIYRFFGTQKTWVDAVTELERTKVLCTEDMANLMEMNARRIIPGVERLAARRSAGAAVRLTSQESAG